MPACLKCGAPLTVNEEGVAPVLCDRCAGTATRRARRGLSTGTMRDYPVTAALVAINVAIFIAMIINGGSLMGFSGRYVIQWGSNFGPYTLSGQYWRLITSTFVHGGILHLALNMWCLWSLGQLSEKLFGHMATAVLYLLTGLGGSLLSIAYEPVRNSVGASGAIFGLAGALLIGIKFGDLKISSGQRRSIFTSLIFFVIFSFSMGGSGNIDNMAHLGGFVAGLIIGLPLASSLASSPMVNRTIKATTLLISTLLLAGAGRELVQRHGHVSSISVAEYALAHGDYSTAINLLERATAADPEDTASFVELGHAYRLSHQPQKAIIAYKRALELNPRDEEVRQDLEDLQPTIQH